MIGIFVDINNLYSNAARLYNSRIDYEKLYNYFKGEGETIHAIAYGQQLSDEAKPFIIKLQSIGFLTKYKNLKNLLIPSNKLTKAHSDIEMTIDAINLIPKMNCFVLCSSDPELEELVSYVRRQGVYTTILACDISKELKNVANSWNEIQKELLHELRSQSPVTSSLGSNLDVIG